MRQDLPLIHHRFQASLGEDARLRHFLHGIGLLRFLPLDLPHLAETAFADAINVIEVAFSERYNVKRVRDC